MRPGVGPRSNWFHSLVVHPAVQVMELFRFCLRIPIRVFDLAFDGFHRAAVVCMGFELGPVVVGRVPSSEALRLFPVLTAAILPSVYP